MDRNRLLYIDQLRGLAILPVVMIHLYTGYKSGGGRNDSIDMIMSIISTFNMPLFFFISGYIVSRSIQVNTWKDVFRFCQNKFLNLILPVFIWKLIVEKFFFTRVFQPIDWTDFVDVFNGKYLWFLPVLFYFMLAYGISKKFENVNRKLFVLIPIMAWSIFITVFYCTGYLSQACLCYPYFIFGIIVSSYPKIGKMIESNHVFPSSLFVFALASGFWVSGQTSLFNIVVRVIAAVSAIMFFYNLVKLIDWNIYVDRLIRFIGVNTLSIYLLHWYFLYPAIIYSSNWLLAFIELLLFAVCISMICIGIAKVLGHSEILNLIFFGKIQKRKKISNVQYKEN